MVNAFALGGAFFAPQKTLAFRSNLLAAPKGFPPQSRLRGRAAPCALWVDFGLNLLTMIYIPKNLENHTLFTALRNWSGKPRPGAPIVPEKSL
jgi:hypothetical protein